MRNFVQDGDALTLTAPYNVAPGDGILVGALFGVAKNPALAGAPTEVMPEGVFDMTKAAGQAWTQGQKVYWDNTAHAVTSSVGAGNPVIGATTQAAASADVVGRVYLDGCVR